MFFILLGIYLAIGLGIEFLLLYLNPFEEESAWLLSMTYWPLMLIFFFFEILARYVRRKGKERLERK